jgi:predicted nuclease of predicted toxin-antitoxin system
MRWLIDNALSPEVAARLVSAGHDAVHVREYGLAAATDTVIFDRAMHEARIIVSADTDFGTLLVGWPHPQPSVVLFRGATPRTPATQADLLLRLLPRFDEALRRGAVVVIEPGRHRVRPLPILPRE